MKKTVILLLAVLYITLTSGVMVNIHYCMGRIAAVNYGHEEDKNCGKCGMDQKEGCCQTEHKLLKAGGDHLNVQKLTAFFPIPSDVPPEFPDFITFTYHSRDHHYSQYHSPPDARGNNLGLYNCVFRI